MGNEIFKPINGHEVEFFVNIEGRAVCALIRGCTGDLRAHISKLKTIPVGVLDLGLCSEMADSYHAVARCHEPDVFNIMTGKKIAYEKLNNKYWMYMYKRIQKADDKLKEAFFHTKDALLDNTVADCWREEM